MGGNRPLWGIAKRWTAHGKSISATKGPTAPSGPSADRVGISKNDTRNQYLAYHEGRTGFARGSYNSKAWLLRVASEVDARAQTYRAQLVSCGKV